MNNKTETEARTPNARVKLLRKKLFGDEVGAAARAAEALGIYRSLYYGLEDDGANARTVSPKWAKQISEKSGQLVSPEWILFGVGPGFSAPCVDKTSYRLSLWLATDISALIDIANGRYPISEKTITMDSDEAISPKTFLLRVPDRAMTRTTGGMSYEEGSRVIVDAERGDKISAYEPEEVIVVLKKGQDKAIIRELTRVRDAQGRTADMLQAYNSKFSDEVFEEGDRVAGVVVGLFWLQPRHK